MDDTCVASDKSGDRERILEVRKVDREIAVQRIGLMKELRIRIVGLENQARRIRDDRATLWKRLETAFNARMFAHQANSSGGQ